MFVVRTSKRLSTLCFSLSLPLYLSLSMCMWFVWFMTPDRVGWSVVERGCEEGCWRSGEKWMLADIKHSITNMTPLHLSMSHHHTIYSYVCPSVHTLTKSCEILLVLCNSFHKTTTIADAFMCRHSSGGCMKYMFLKGPHRKCVH